MALVDPRQEATPRARRRWQPPFWLPWFMLSVWLAIGLIGGGFALREALHLHDGEGPPDGTAIIVSAKKVRSDKSERADVTFSIDGAQHECRMMPSEVASLSSGDTQPYWIVDGDPMVASCTRYEHRSAIAGIVFGCAAGVAVIVVFVCFLWMRRRNRIYQSGEIAIAKITRVVTRRFQRRNAYRIWFETDRGRGKAFLARRYFDSTGDPPPEPSSSAYVVFDPNRPEKVLFYGLTQ